MNVPIVLISRQAAADATTVAAGVFNRHSCDIATRTLQRVQVVRQPSTEVAILIADFAVRAGSMTCPVARRRATWMLHAVDGGIVAS
ncbi:hypothetical protein LVJ94_37690 [Pendulispora rubella]|uniref:Uncharacterized protein n=1 Tax=Pendulispora rubella TaxID=2741070 RepID=A0ABZ2L212_9BACT